MNEMNLINIDGKYGGGQILRTALSLSMITGKGFRIKNIRGQRKKSGLMRQHLTCVEAATKISGASAQGASLASTQLSFVPEQIVAGDYHFKIGTAGSTSLLAQTLIPALLQASGKSKVILEGGTHNPLAPTASYLQQVFLPMLKKMGAEVELKLTRYGFAPSGGGAVELSIKPCAKLAALHLLERGELVSRSLDSYLAHVHDSVGKRELDALNKRLKWGEECCHIIDASNSRGSGNCVTAAVHYEHVSEMITAHGAHGVRAERVARTAGSGMFDYLSSGAVVGNHLADQLLLPMSLAGAGSSIITAEPTNHFLSNIETIEAFLGDSVNIKMTEQADKLYLIEVGRIES